MKLCLFIYPNHGDFVSLHCQDATILHLYQPFSVMKTLVIDNYDSFTYNLVHYLEQCSEAAVSVKRNDEILADDVDAFDQIVISPGPGLPETAGITIPMIKKYCSTKKILGICLGHQAMAVAFGGTLKNLAQVHHGVAKKTILQETDELFHGVPKSFLSARYHSWTVDAQNLPKEFLITACDENGEIMAMRHSVYNLHSVQFHPESILTEHGIQIIHNWLHRL